MPETCIVLSSGEPAGVGPDIIAAIDSADFDAKLVVIGDRELLETRARNLNLPVRFEDYRAGTGRGDGLQVLHLPLNESCEAGQLNPSNAGYVIEMLTRACRGCLAGEFDAMVTAPVHKEIISRAGYDFTGHTEFLAQLCEASPLMLLTGDSMRVALVTTHLALREVADAIDQKRIIGIANILHADLKRRFGLDHPHIKVCGLNPHAGEGGVLGREEIDIIIPAIESLQSQGLHVSGPYPADTLFTSHHLSDADAVLAMYHDQGLPVLKHASFHDAVNTTLGLPIIRTSVDHGTALDLAGSGSARPDSLFRAIESAISQVACQRRQP